MDPHVMSRRQLLQALGLAGVAAPFAAAFGSSTAFAQGRCRDGFGQGNCPLDMETATKAITPVFAPTGWRTVSLDHIAFQVADHKSEAAFYVALMGWKLRSLDDTQAVMDLGDWGTVVFKKSA
ncbi:MAG TPA: twin-arginine translocation signal domain-containing protein, partial [Vicinamibacterales bacterium]|nr:twin-arginine translocation signal domain-containing protein [Vicinamibacterales bacterium]